MSDSTTSCPKCGGAIPPEAPQGLCPKCLLQQASFPTETGPATRHMRPAPPSRDELAAAFPHLQILELIGQGGMGFVYKARQPKLDRFVALKILAQPLAEQSSFAERFTREGRTLARLNHPNIVTIHDFGQAGPFFYLLMEYVDGVNLRQAMKAGAITSEQALAIVPRICDALQYAHNEGVLHRDIKPDNILLDTRGRVKIADFGIAKLIAEAVAENPLTGSGATLGTPHYMAPEQIEKPNAVDHRADIYSLGVVFYEMLTGELPLGRFGPPSEKSGADPRLDEVVFQTLEKQPDRRPQSADEVKTRVETIASQPGEAPKSEGAVTFKMSRCYITTPAFLRSRLGRLFRFTGRGELRLDENSLTFAPQGNWIVIPLRSITSLSVGDFPAGIGRLKFISVTFTEKGETHRVFLIPCRWPLQSIFRTNDQVAEWLEAIRQAVKARTGIFPPSSASDFEPLPEHIREMPSITGGFLKFAMIGLVFFGLMMAAIFGSYALLMHNFTRKPDKSSDESATLEPARIVTTSKAPLRTIDVVDVSSPSHSTLRMITKSEPAVGETFVGLIRYGNGPWSKNPSPTMTWTSGSGGLGFAAVFEWTTPAGFNTEFDLAAAKSRLKATADEGPIPLFAEPTPLFTITNATGQVISGGLRLQRSPIELTNHPVARIRNFSAHRESQQKMLASGIIEAPQGYRIIATGTYGGKAITAQVSGAEGAYQTMTWQIPDGVGITSFQFGKPVGPTVSSQYVDVTYGQNFEVLSLPNQVGDANDYFRAYLELLPMPGVTPPTDKSIPEFTNAHSPTIAEVSKERIQVTLLKPKSGEALKIEPGRIDLAGIVDLNLDRAIFAVLRGIPTNSPGSIAAGYADVRWVCSGFDKTNRLIKLAWRFPESFGMQSDLLPALSRYWGSDERKNISIELDRATRLFTVTNALGQEVACEIDYRRQSPEVKDDRAGVIVAGAQQDATTNGLRLNIFVRFPAGVQIIASAEENGKRLPATLSRSMSISSSLSCDWRLPDEFGFGGSSTNRNIIVAIGKNRTLFDDLIHLIQAGDARIIADKPLEVFALTNAEGKVFRGLLELSHAQQ